MHVVEETALNSPALRTSLGKGICDSLLKAAIKQFPIPNPCPKQKKQQRGAMLRKTNSEDYEEEWSPLMEDDEDESNNERRGQIRAAEEGYEADREVDSGSSDNQGAVKCGARHRKRPRAQRRSEEAAKVEKSCLRGLIIYPRICQFLFKLLRSVYGSAPCVTGRWVKTKITEHNPMAPDDDDKQNNNKNERTES